MIDYENDEMSMMMMTTMEMSMMMMMSIPSFVDMM